MFRPHRILAPVEELINFARSQGVKLALYKVVRWGCSASLLKKRVRFSVAEVYRLPVSELTCPPRIPKVFTVRKAKPADISALDLFYSKPGKTHARLQRGDDCIIALRGGEVSGASWMTLGPTDYRDDLPELGCVFSIPINACWTYDGLGIKLGAWAAVKAYKLRLLRDLGVEEVFCQIDCANTQCLNSHRSLGYQSVGRICHLKIPGMSIQRYRNLDGKWRRLPGRMGTLGLRRGDPQFQELNDYSSQSAGEDLLPDP